MDSKSSIFWNNVKQQLKAKGLLQQWLCLKTDVNLQTLRNMIYYKRFPGVDTAYRIAQALDCRIEDLLGEEYANGESSSILQVPLYDQLLSAGKGEFLPDEDSISGYIPVPSRLREYASTAAALTVRGDSMESTLFDGDIVICDGIGWQNKDGIYALQYKGSGFIKRLHRDSNLWHIISDNPDYKEMTESVQSTDIRILGKIHYSIRQL